MSGALHAEVRSYLYNGMHRYYDRERHTFDTSRLHYDWKYRISLNGIVLQHRQGFHDWASAYRSMQGQMRKIADAIASTGEQR